MEEKKILAIFGGSFNPPLNSHFSLAQQIVNEYENIEKVIFVPVNSKYEKDSYFYHVGFINVYCSCSPY